LAQCCAAAIETFDWRDLADLSPIVEAESEGRTSLKASTRSNGRVKQLQGRLRGVERRQFKRAAADRAWKQPEGLRTMCAPASRELDPSTRCRRTIDFDRVDEPPEGAHHATSIGPVHRADRVEDRLRRARRIEPRLALRICRMHRVEDRRIDGNGEHQRRLTDSLRPINAWGWIWAHM
jgi:hypothetical protein